MAVKGWRGGRLRRRCRSGIAVGLMAFGCLLGDGPPPPADAADRKAALEALVAAYPSFLARVEGNDLVWQDGTRQAIDDGRTDKSFAELLDAPDIEDQFYAPYPLGAAGLAPPRDVDPGRIRYEPFFERMYGSCRKGEVEPRLVAVRWLPRHGGGTVRATTVNGVDKALAAVSGDLDALPDRFVKFLVPSSGTYNCRVIAGTGRTSVHAYGAAIDLNSAHAHYWRWAKPDSGGLYRYENEIPIEIVEIFERHGFIWGGKWYHFDTMHFEYRPELIELARQQEGKAAP